MSSGRVEIAIAGGGPAGLAVAIRAARAGFRTLLLERAAGIPDKACGEGLMPQGVRGLETLGALGSIPLDARMPFAGIRYVLESGRTVDARFRNGTGLGIRRLALSTALREAALAAGATLDRGSVRGFISGDHSVQVQTDRDPIEAGLLVAADGLQSPLRRAAGLDRSKPWRGEPASDELAKSPDTVAAANITNLSELHSGPHPRFGVRRHFSCAPWSDLVEVYWSDGAECYATPVGPALVNIAFLWEPRTALPAHDSDRFASLLARFPAVAKRLEGVPSACESRGAGPLFRPTTGRAADRLALVGDAAGYVDAVTGQGLSLAFAGAEALVASLPRNLADRAALSAGLQSYDRTLRSAWLRYAIPARALLALTRQPRVRKAALGAAARMPALFSLIVEAIASA